MAYNRQYYVQHRAQHVRYAVKNRRLYRLRNQKGVENYLKDHPCVDCAECDPIVLEFDHVRGVKRNSLAMLVRDGAPWLVIEAEIAKCEVRCANCHRRKTARERLYKAGARVYEQNQAAARQA